MKVFISSTFYDLREHRKAVRDTILRLRHHPIAMEDFGARPQTWNKAVLQAMEDCGAFVGIYAHRYGTIPAGDIYSITEQEFRKAQSLGLRCFLYRVDPEYPWPPKYIDQGTSREKLERFMRRVDTFLRGTFTDPVDLARQVGTDLGRELPKPAIGPKILSLPGSKTKPTATSESQTATVAFIVLAICVVAVLLMISQRTNTSSLGSNIQATTSSAIVSEMLTIPGGDFLMGTNDTAAKDEERPQHTVYLNEFKIDKYEVTNAMYKACVTSNSCKILAIMPNDHRVSYYDNPAYINHPMTYVSWNDANAFCAWAGKRLPTEAEWEKAARGTDGRIYPWGNTFDGNLLNSMVSRKNAPASVGSFPNGRSPYGVMDMAGNVSEWVSDWYDANYYRSSQVQNPKGPANGTQKVFRGGAWNADEKVVRTTSRRMGSTDYNISYLGFRCAQ
jgi:formylglycine-generating enzyme required for sulfatase activity